MREREVHATRAGKLKCDRSMIPIQRIRRHGESAQHAACSNQAHSVPVSTRECPSQDMHLLKLVPRLSDVEDNLGVVSAKRTQTIPVVLLIVIGGAPVAIVG